MTGMTASKARAEIVRLGEEIGRLTVKKRMLENELRADESADFISKNKVKKSEVEMSESEDKPYFSHIKHFATWLRQNSDKKYCEWNGGLFIASELVSGMMNKKGSVDDLF